MRLVERIRRVGMHQGVRASAANALWLSSDTLIRFVTAFFIGLWVARYLGPESYGQLQYAVSWVELFSAIAWLGVGETVVRDIVRGGTSENELLGSTLALRMIGSVLAIFLTITVGALLVGTHVSIFALIWILCLAIPFTGASGAIWIYFEARMQLRPPAMTKNLVTLLCAAYRAGLILFQASLAAFAWVFAGEAVVLCAGLFFAYKLHGGHISDWRFSYSRMTRLLRDGFPIIFSSLAASVNLRVDQLMLGWFSGFQEVGIYAAAARFSEIWWLVPPILMKSLASKFIFPREVRPQLQRNVAWISAGMLAIALIPCAIVMFAKEVLIGSLLGPDYLKGVPVLMIHIWTAVFIFLDAPATHYLLATDRQSVLIAKSCGAVIINIALGVLLIPPLGVAGAAIATLAAQAWLGFIFYLVHPRTRDVSRIQVAAIYHLFWGWWHPKVSAP